MWDPAVRSCSWSGTGWASSRCTTTSTPDGVIFGSEPKAILTHPEVDAVARRGRPARVPQHRQDAGARNLRGMCEVRAGSAGARLPRRSAPTAPTGSSRPASTPTIWTPPSRQIRGLLEDIVAHQIIADVPVCTLLSGGLDSSAVTALAADVGRTRRTAARLLGGLRRRTASAFQSDVVRAPPTLRSPSRSRSVGVEHNIVRLDNAQPPRPRGARGVLRAFDLPLTMGDMEYSLYLLCRAIRRLSTVALSGERPTSCSAGTSGSTTRRRSTPTTSRGSRRRNAAAPSPRCARSRAVGSPRPRRVPPAPLR